MKKNRSYILLFFLLISKNALPSPYVEGFINCVEPNLENCMHSNDIKSYTNSVCSSGYIVCRNKGKTINNDILYDKIELSQEEINSNIQKGEAISENQRKQIELTPKFDEKKPEKKRITVKQDQGNVDRWLEKEARETKEWRQRNDDQARRDNDKGNRDMEKKDQRNREFQSQRGIYK